MEAEQELNPNIARRQYEETSRRESEQKLAEIMLDSSVTLQDLERNLRGEFFFAGYDEQGNEVKGWQKSGLRLANEEGVRAIMTFVGLNLTPITYLTNLDDQDIENMMVPIHQDLAGMLVDKQDEFEIDSAYLKPLLTTLTNIIWQAQKRSLFAKTLESFTESHKSMEVREYKKPRKLLPF